MSVSPRTRLGAYEVVGPLGAGDAPKPISMELALSQYEPFNLLSPVSPDGRQVAVLGAGGGVLLVPLDGAEPRKAPGVATNKVPVQWTADGQKLYVFRRGVVPAPSFRVDVETGRHQPFRELRPRDPSGVVGIRRFRVAPDGRAHVFSYMQNLSTLYLVQGVK